MFFLAALLPAAVVSGTLLLSISDPVGDATGDGSYQVPLQPVISAAQPDVRSFEAENVGGKLRLTVAFGAVGNPWNAPSPFSGVVLDVFIKTAVGGAKELSGLGFKVPGASGWQEHYRVNGFTIQHFSADAAGQPQPNPDLPRLSWQGTDLTLDTGLRAGKYSYWVTSSLYTPLSPDGLLRPGGDTTAGLKSAREGTPTPLDVLLSGDQKAVYASGVLPAVGQTRDVRALILLGLAATGLIIAVLAGVLTWRRS